MKILLVLMSFCFINNAFAKYQTVTSTQTVEEMDERAARAKAIEKATDAVTIDFIKKELGAEKYQANIEKVDTQVKTLKNRFIPFFKIISNTKTQEGHQFKIEVKFSTADLRLVLQQKGLFASSEKTGITLPFIEFNNAISGESFRWWSPEFKVSNDLESLALNFEKELFQGFLDKGLFLLRPQAFRMAHLVPPFMRKSYLTQTEMVQLTNMKQGQLYLDGRVDIITSPLRENAYRVRVQVSCKQASNGKSVAEVVRTFDTNSGEQLTQITSKINQLASETGVEIADQVYDLWQRGALEAQLLQLAVTGDLNHQQLLKFKNELSEKLNLDNGLVERLYEPGRVTFETDYAGGVESLSRKLQRTKFEGFISQVVSSNPEQIILDVKVAQ